MPLTGEFADDLKWSVSWIGITTDAGYNIGTSSDRWEAKDLEKGWEVDIKVSTPLDKELWLKVR